MYKNFLVGKVIVKCNERKIKKETIGSVFSTQKFGYFLHFAVSNIHNHRKKKRKNGVGLNLMTVELLPFGRHNNLTTGRNRKHFLYRYSSVRGNTEFT